MRPAFRAASLIAATALLLTTPQLRAQQALASAVAAPAAAATAEQVGCYGCNYLSGIVYCAGGYVPGWWGCSVSLEATCFLYSPGCGAGASLPVDLDGSAQYVSRMAEVGAVALGPPERSAVETNCEGVIVSRHQSAAEIAAIRNHTATLSL